MTGRLNLVGIVLILAFKPHNWFVPGARRSPSRASRMQASCASYPCGRSCRMPAGTARHLLSWFLLSRCLSGR